jgi:hypothetical protein
LKGGAHVTEKSSKMNIMNKKLFFLKNTYSTRSQKLGKATISFVLSVRHAISPSVWSKATAEHPLVGFS